MPIQYFCGKEPYRICYKVVFSTIYRRADRENHNRPQTIARNIVTKNVALAFDDGRTYDYHFSIPSSGKHKSNANFFSRLLL